MLRATEGKALLAVVHCGDSALEDSRTTVEWYRVNSEASEIGPEVGLSSGSASVSSSVKWEHGSCVSAVNEMMH